MIVIFFWLRFFLSFFSSFFFFLSFLLSFFLSFFLSIFLSFFLSLFLKFFLSILCSLYLFSVFPSLFSFPSVFFCSYFLFFFFFSFFHFFRNHVPRCLYFQIAVFVNSPTPQLTIDEPFQLHHQYLFRCGERASGPPCFSYRYATPTPEDGSYHLSLPRSNNSQSPSVVIRYPQARSTERHFD